jgi:ubiquinone/menaquinone biosynthesis C-methylase UbiE
MTTIAPSDAGATIGKIERAYDAPPWWYDLRGLFILTFAYRSGLLSQLRLFGDRIGPQHLEVAIGSGSLFELVIARRRLMGRPLPRRVVAFDLAPAMLAGARRRFARTSWIELLAADVERLPLADASFDTANVANAAHCFRDLDAALREVRRVLRPGGTLTLNALLHPRGGRLARRIAAAIDAWGMKKGILESPFEAGDVLTRVGAAGFVVERWNVHGNALDVVATCAGGS